MNRSIVRVARAGLLAVAIIALLPPPLHAKPEEIAGSFTGKVMCKSGKKKAEFKSLQDQNLIYYSASDITKQVQALTWPSSSNKLSFDQREKIKLDLQRALTMIRAFSCDTQDNPAQSTGTQSGTGPNMQAPSGQDTPNPYQGHKQ